MDKYGLPIIKTSVHYSMTSGRTSRSITGWEPVFSVTGIDRAAGHDRTTVTLVKGGIVEFRRSN